MIRAVKLISGEEIVGEFIETSEEDCIKIDKPVIMVPSKEGYMFVPFMPYVEEFFLYGDRTVTPALKINQLLEDSYREHFGSGLKIVRPNLSVVPK